MTHETYVRETVANFAATAPSRTPKIVDIDEAIDSLTISFYRNGEAPLLTVSIVPTGEVFTEVAQTFRQVSFFYNEQDLEECLAFAMNIIQSVDAEQAVVGEMRSRFSRNLGRYIQLPTGERIFEKGVEMKFGSFYKGATFHATETFQEWLRANRS